MERLPSNLRRKLRDYRFAYWCVAIAETICLGALLIAFLEPPALLLAILWIGWKLWRSPTDQHIAARIEEHNSELKEKLVSVVELSQRADGSPELLRQAFAEVDQQVTAVEIAPLLSLRPVLLLIAATIIVNVAVSVQRQKTIETASISPKQPPSEPRRGAPSHKYKTVTAIAAALRTQPESVLRQLPPYARSLDKAEADAQRAATASGIDTEGFGAQAAEALSEFARLAREIPELASLAADAEALAQGLAQTGSSAVTQAPQDFTNSIASSQHGLSPIKVETLPPTPTGESWRSPAISAASTGGEQVPTQYQAAVRNYFEHLAASSH